MRIASSLKKLKKRFPSCKIRRRRKHLFVTCPENPRGKAKQA